MAVVKIPEYVEDMYNAFHVYSSRNISEGVLYKLMVFYDELLEKNVWRIVFLPECNGCKGFEIALYTDTPEKIDIRCSEDSKEYISSRDKNDYRDFPYPKDVEEFISTLFKDFYCYRNDIQDMCKKAVLFTTQIGIRKIA